ncbi:DUF2892 domain-containing protein (plasmid) [Sphingomonas naphthae]|jgi:hypothetical protein|uniref:DUF2892 domain-containing protein n=1 Tax=Sphingomonas naphthae TaxID=1813468 RepID=A0ABY7TRE1_9SPHN|nr:DUF2892 domain-containing protein [Sphingomonas naphthae]WCT75748.1 DUF2892 domain-containing protein [Sphingomonas naphthae]
MRNIGTTDRIIRLLVGLAILAAYGLGLIGGTLALALGAVAAVLLITSLIATCPAYLPFGVSTRRQRP